MGNKDKDGWKKNKSESFNQNQDSSNLVRKEYTEKETKKILEIEANQNQLVDEGKKAEGKTKDIKDITL